MKERVFGDSVRQSRVLTKRLAKAATEMENEGIRIHKAVYLQRNKVKEKWMIYEKSLKINLKLII